ncbi:MmyB family transcriptional regulator [Frankia sp. AiPs1]
MPGRSTPIGRGRPHHGRDPAHDRRTPPARPATRPRLVRLIGELSLGSEAFHVLWASHHLHEKTHGHKCFRHPAVGEVAFDSQTFHGPGPDHHLLVIYTAVPGSPAEQALNFLGSNAVARAPSPAQR